METLHNVPSVDGGHPVGIRRRYKVESETWIVFEIREDIAVGAVVLLGLVSERTNESQKGNAARWSRGMKSRLPCDAWNRTERVDSRVWVGT